jgi:hypothetical protein
MPVHHDPKRRLHGFGRTFALLPVRNAVSLQRRKVDTVFVVLAAWVDQESHELRILQGLLAVPLLGDYRPRLSQGSATVCSESLQRAAGLVKFAAGGKDTPACLRSGPKQYSVQPRLCSSVSQTISVIPF